MRFLLARCVARGGNRWRAACSDIALPCKNCFMPIDARWAVVLVVVGSLLGQWAGIKNQLGDLWFWLGNQGWEYLEIGLEVAARRVLEYLEIQCGRAAEGVLGPGGSGRGKAAE